MGQGFRLDEGSYLFFPGRTLRQINRRRKIHHLFCDGIAWLPVSTVFYAGDIHSTHFHVLPALAPSLLGDVLLIFCPRWTNRTRLVGPSAFLP